MERSATPHGNPRRAGVTPAERTVRCVLHRLGYRFRLRRADLPGSPQVVLPRWHLALFIADCTRHPHPDCTRANQPSDPTAGAAEVRRVAQAVAALERRGWQTLIVQACEADDPESLAIRLDVALQGHLIAPTAGGRLPQPPV